MGLRELLILVLILAIVGVILRGLYVALRARRGQLRMALEKNVPNYDPDELSLSELPNGGARMVERSFAQVVRQNSEFSARDRAARNKLGDHAIPVLMDSVDDDEPVQERSSGVANARQAARQKHLLGTRREPQPQKPTHRPIDRMQTQSAATAAAAAVVSGAASAAVVDDLPDEDIPVDSRTVSDPLHDDSADAPTLTASRTDDPVDDLVADEIADEEYPYADEDVEDEVLNPPPYEQETAADDLDEAWGDELDDELDGESEDDFEGESDDDFDDDLEAESEEDVDYADDDLDDDADDYEDDEPEEDDSEDDESEDDFDDDDADDDDIDDDFDDEDDDDFEDDDLEDDLEDDFEDDEQDDDDLHDDFDDDESESARNLDYSDDPDEDSDEDEESYAMHGSEQYVDPLDADLLNYDDYDDDYATSHEHGEARSWWQKVGDKLGFGGSGSDDSHHREAARERAEPVIGDSSFDKLISTAAPAAAAAIPEKRDSDSRGSRKRRHHDRDLDPRRKQEREQLRAQGSAPKPVRSEPQPVRSEPQPVRSEPQPFRSEPQAAAQEKVHQKELDLDAPDLWEDQAGHGASDAYSRRRDEGQRYEEPAYDEPYDESAYDEPAYEEPAYEEPAYEEPVYEKQQSARPEPEQEKDQSSMPDYNEVLVINVMAKSDREFAGVDLLQALLATGLRFGEMNIFHRHLDGRANTPVVFSVANMVNPGTFDLNQISEFSTRGVCFFMTLPNVATSMQAFDLMLDVAQRVRIALDGDLKDDNRSVMTAQTIEHYRQRVRDFDLRQLRQQK